MAAPFAPLIDDTTLARFRALQNANMRSTVDLYVFSNDRLPGGIYSRTPIWLSTVPCRLYSTSDGEAIVAEQPVPTGTYMLVMPIDTDTALVERVVVHGASHDEEWTAELIVAGTREPRSFSASRQLQCRLAPDPLIPPSDVGTVIVSEA